MTKAKRKTESPEHGASHCFSAVPYRMVVFIKMNDGKPLYRVAGSEKPAMGAEKALRLAHSVYGGVCFYCKKPVAPNARSTDHAQSKASGGACELQNLLIACRDCNTDKGAKAIELFDAEAGREWLSAVLHQVQARLNRL